MSDDKPVVYIQGLGGAVFEMTLPLQPAIQKQYAAGDVIQVNQDGSAYDGPPLLNRNGSPYEDDGQIDEEAEDDSTDGAEDDGATTPPKRGRGKAPAEGD